MTKTLTLRIGDFTRNGPPGSFQHYFEHRLEAGGSICLEACMDGYCVARYDSNKKIIGKKICTKLGELMMPQIAPGFSLGSGEALTKAVDIANTLL